MLCGRPRLPSTRGLQERQHTYFLFRQVIRRDARLGLQRSFEVRIHNHRVHIRLAAYRGSDSANSMRRSYFEASRTTVQRG